MSNKVTKIATAVAITAAIVFPAVSLLAKSDAAGQPMQQYDDGGAQAQTK